MADDKSGSDEIVLTVKTSRAKESMRVALSSSVKDVRCVGCLSAAGRWGRKVAFRVLCFFVQFKQDISKRFDNAPVDQLCVIFAGKILKDDDTIGSYGEAPTTRKVPWFVKSAPGNHVCTYMYVYWIAFRHQGWRHGSPCYQVWSKSKFANLLVVFYQIVFPIVVLLAADGGSTLC